MPVNTISRFIGLESWNGLSVASRVITVGHECVLIQFLKSNIICIVAFVVRPHPELTLCMAVISFPARPCLDDLRRERRMSWW